MRTLLFKISIFISFASPIALSSMSAYASIFVEPYVGLAKQEIHTKSSGFTLIDLANGFALGTRLGVQFGSKFFVAAEYFQGGPYEFKSSFTNYELTNSMIGIIAGLDYKIIRFWLGYYFDNEFVVSNGGSTYTGTCIKAAFGLSASQKFRANLELLFHDITKQQTNTGSFEITDDIDYITTMVTLSIPISLD